MVTRTLEAMGLFVGKALDANHEARFFDRINLWLLAQTGSSPEHPQGIYYLTANTEFRAMTAEYISRYLLPTPRAISYLGWKKYLRYRSPSRLDIPWGWKSPLNTYTLPLWLEIFPNAKVIHIYRHGIDVANSLRSRSQREMRRTLMQQLYYRLPFLHWIRPKTGGFVPGFRFASLEGGLSLWEEYLAEARQHVRNLGARAIELKYEDFLSGPDSALKRLAQFCELSFNDAALARAAGMVKKERAYAYLENPQLREFANRVRKRLVTYSYD